MPDPAPTDSSAPLRDGVEVWLAAPRIAEDPREEAAARSIAAPEEIARCETFRVDADRRGALVTRAVVRRALSAHAPVAPEAWRFESGALGRPEIAAPAGTGLRFSVSHTRELVACAVTSGADVGVDVERIAAHPDLMALAAKVMDAGEFASIGRLAEASRPERFCAAWTLKEAYLKARGLGLSLSPRLVGFDLDAAGRIAVRMHPGADDEPSGWSVELLRAETDHLLAVAVRGLGPARSVRVLRLGSILGHPAVREPSRLAASAPRVRTDTASW